MKYVYLKEKDNKYSFLKGLFINIRAQEEEGIPVLEIPFLKKRREFMKLCKKLKKKGIKGICYGKTENKLLTYTIKQEFYTFDGESIFFHLFPQIITFLSSVKNMSISDCHLVFISDNPFTVEKYIHTIYKRVKRISVITNKKPFFLSLSEKCRQEYGLYIDLKKKEDKCKKYNYIYVNLDKNIIMHEKKLKGCTLLDIYNKYKSGYHEVIIGDKVKGEDWIQKNGIIKNLPFIEFLEKIKEDYGRKNYKVINIKK